LLRSPDHCGYSGTNVRLLLDDQATADGIRMDCAGWPDQPVLAIQRWYSSLDMEEGLAMTLRPATTSFLAIVTRQICLKRLSLARS